MLDRGAVVNVTISSNNYQCSPLVQGGLETCKVSVTASCVSEEAKS